MTGSSAKTVVLLATVACVIIVLVSRSGRAPVVVAPPAGAVDAKPQNCPAVATPAAASYSLTPNPALMHNIKKLPTPKDSEVCLAFISCARLHFLNLSVAAAFEHMEGYENVRYQSVWIDQVPSETSTLIAQAWPWSARVVASEAMGFRWPYNLALFTLCRAKYVILIEEDHRWFTGVEREIYRPDAIREAMELIEKDQRISGVLLQGDPNADKHDAEFERKSFVDSHGKTREWCLRKTSKSSYEASFSSYMNGVVLYSVERLLKVGMVPIPFKNDEESDYADMVRSAGLMLASIKRKDSCDPCNSGCNALSGNIAKGAGDSTKAAGSGCGTKKDVYGY